MVDKATEPLGDRMLRVQIDAEAKSILDTEQSLNDQLDDLRERYPDVLAKMDEISAGLIEVGTRREAIKKRLVQSNDYDTHVVEGLRFGLSKVVKMSATDVSKVPDQFKVYRAVADEKKAAEHYKLTGEVPEGFTDKSYTKLNWRTQYNDTNH